VGVCWQPNIAVPQAGRFACDILAQKYFRKGPRSDTSQPVSEEDVPEFLWPFHEPDATSSRSFRSQALGGESGCTAGL